MSPCAGHTQLQCQTAVCGRVLLLLQDLCECVDLGNYNVHGDAQHLFMWPFWHPEFEGGCWTIGKLLDPVCMCIYVHIHTYIYTHTHTQSHSWCHAALQAATFLILLHYISCYTVLLPTKHPLHPNNNICKLSIFHLWYFEPLGDPAPPVVTNSKRPLFCTAEDERTSWIEFLPCCKEF
jgi:hypothetical protein